MSQTPHILICDDDPVVHESLALYFENEHFTHSDAYDGREGLAMVAENKPDLILLDVMMPELTGLEVCKEIRKTLSTPIIILTAKGEEIDRVVGLEIGADDYIVKPFSPREVIARIKAVLRRSNEPTEVSNILRLRDWRSILIIIRSRSMVRLYLVHLKKLKSFTFLLPIRARL